MAKMQYKVSPKGTLVYPWLNTPDTKFNPEGDFKTSLKLNQEGHDAMLAALEPVLDEFVAADKAANPKRKKWEASLPYSEELDDSGEETGNYLWAFKQAAQVTLKDGKVLTFDVTLVDAETNPIDVQVGGGTEAKIKYGIKPYAMSSTSKYGLSLKLAAVQILNLVSAGGSVSGFEKEEGYVGASVSESLGSSEDIEDEDF